MRLKAEPSGYMSTVLGVVASACSAGNDTFPGGPSKGRVVPCSI